MVAKKVASKDVYLVGWSVAKRVWSSAGRSVAHLAAQMVVRTVSNLADCLVEW